MRSWKVDHSDPEQTAREMAAVGMVPLRRGPHPVGFRFEVGGQPFVVTGPATEAEFLMAFEEHVGVSIPAGYPGALYYRVSTD